jgi:hypothetical protein
LLRSWPESSLCLQLSLFLLWKSSLVLSYEISLCWYQVKVSLDWRCQNEEISHLCFADDLMVFSNGDLEPIAIINNVLHIFQHLSGLTPNPAKSEFSCV